MIKSDIFYLLSNIPHTIDENGTVWNETGSRMKKHTSSTGEEYYVFYISGKTVNVSIKTLLGYVFNGDLLTTLGGRVIK